MDTAQYPRSLTINFRALNLDTLRRYVSHFNIPTSDGAGRGDLAAACARYL